MVTSAHATHDYSQVGKQLMQARRRRRLSLDDVAVVLRIPPQQLKALEEGDLSVFSAQVYARGAYAKYARFLGLESLREQMTFLRLLSGVGISVPLHLHTPRSWLARVVTGNWILMMAVSGVALVVGGYIAVQVQSFFRLPALEIFEPVAGIVYSDEVNVSGSAEDEVDVLINEEAVLLADDATFSMPVGLHKGVNVLRIEARNAAGRVRVEERHILVPRDSD